MIELDFEEVYQSWRGYLLEHSPAEHFGVLFDPTKQAKFPYANLTYIGRPTNGKDMEGNELSVDLTFETQGYINNSKIMTLYDIDNANADFFLSLGFRRIGSSQVTRVSGTVTRIMSQFNLMNFTGEFLIDLPTYDG